MSTEHDRDEIVDDASRELALLLKHGWFFSRCAGRRGQGGDGARHMLDRNAALCEFLGSGQMAHVVPAEIFDVGADMGESLRSHGGLGRAFAGKKAGR